MLVTGKWTVTDLTAEGNRMGQSVAINAAGTVAALAGNSPRFADIFTQAGGVWTFTKFLRPTTMNGSSDQLQTTVSMNGTGTMILVGSPGWYQGTGGKYPSAGTIDIFTFTSGLWNYKSSFGPASPASNEWFGSASSLSSTGSVALVGMPGFEKNHLNAGAVEVYSLPPS